MNNGFVLVRLNPRPKANILSKLFFTWIIELCRKGVKTSLEIIDLYRVLYEDSSQNLADRLEANWNKQTSKNIGKSSPSLLKAILDTFIVRYAILGACLFVQLMVFKSFQPTVLAYFITQFQGNDLDIANMYTSAVLLILMTFCSVFLIHQIEFRHALIGMRIRVAVSSLVYRKMLRLSKQSLGKVTAGQLVNILSNDVSRFDYAPSVLHYFWLAPLQITLLTYLGWLQVGVSIFAGVLLMTLLTLPIQGCLAKLTSKYREMIAQRTDHRVKLMNEVIAGIQVIKMYTWEKPFEKIVENERKREVSVITKSSYLRAGYVSSMVFIERATLYLTVVTFFLLGNNLRAEIVFSVAQFFNILQVIMAIFLPFAMAIAAETSITLKRVQDFLTLPEKSDMKTVRSDNYAIELNNITASWATGVTTLNELFLEIPAGSLCAIVGPVGSGKSSVLQLILGELPTDSGELGIGGDLSYASQEPWLFSASVRNNILFGLEYDREKYREVVKVCALLKDFEEFELGDKTLVGERGVSLSGGQRARINLARAIYRSADIYLLDDPLSAVDAHVGKQLFDDCISHYLRNKTRILVTHQLQYLQKADLIVVLKEGSIEAKGTYDELIESDIDFTKLLPNQKEIEEEPIEERSKDHYNTTDRRISHLSRTSQMSKYSKLEDQSQEEEKIHSITAPFADYIKASGSFCRIFSLIFVLLLAQAACSGTDYWVTFWTQEETIRQSNVTKINSNDTFVDHFLTENSEILTVLKTNYTIYIYTGFIIAAIAFTLIRTFAFFKMAMTASKNLHHKMFHCLIKAPMRFFDTNLSGRILNRFSKDMGVIDEVMPRVLIDAIQILLVMTGILVMVVVANYYMLIAIVLVGGLFLKLRSWYVTIAKQVKHLEGMAKSPVFSHLNSSLNGITTIRATRAENVLQEQFDRHQDNHTSAWYLTVAVRTFFGLWLDILSVAFVTIVILAFVMLAQYGQVSGSFVGLAISQSLILTGMLQFGMTQTAEVINQLTSVERVMHYTTLEDEQQLFGGTKLASPKWPEAGSIEFRGLSLRYSEYDSAVLKNLNFKIEAGSKVGVVGRTGAGKSSLISALFRLAPVEGSILIDDVDTKSLRLQEVRNKIAIIPQEPVLFSSTVRYNLDPFGEFQDDTLWAVLKQVELKEAVSSLDMPVAENGSNFSVGQRQLVCLARAILKNSKILVLDEATANVDPKTDAFIQETIRERFGDCTILTIAHRLNTIMDSDKILVMDSGNIVEYDHPSVLLQNEDGVFRKMVEQTGMAINEIIKKGESIK